MFRLAKKKKDCWWCAGHFSFMWHCWTYQQTSPNT